MLVFLSLATRFYRLHEPDEVVFDEVHFGKFASYYLSRTFFFDVHPPIGKMLIAFVASLIGYDGHFHFEEIGQKYIGANVPYIPMRSWTALCGTLTCPLVYLILRECGFSIWASTFSTLLLIFGIFLC